MGMQGNLGAGGGTTVGVRGDHQFEAELMVMMRLQTW